MKIYLELWETLKDYRRWTCEGVGREYLERRGDEHRLKKWGCLHIPYIKTKPVEGEQTFVCLQQVSRN